MTNYQEPDITLCEECGEEFIPPFLDAMYCPKCRKKILRREKSEYNKLHRKELNEFKIEQTREKWREEH